MYENLNKIEKFVFDSCSVFLVLFYIWAAVIKATATQYHRGIYVLITYVLIFLIYRNKHKLLRVLDYMLILLSIVAVGYWIIQFEMINYRIGVETRWDKLIAIFGVFIGIEVARRVVGNIFVFIGIGMLAYGVFGEYMPGILQHPGDSFVNLCTAIFYRSDGIFGIMATVLATYILLFILFGAFLETCGAHKIFIDLPLAAFGHRTGGAAKVAVVASGLFGSISGSAIANTVSTGTFTIPMMKKAGFKPHIAGAIEPAASIGGMFMPPIMGAGGFIMSELTGIPYHKIMIVGFFPALMYFFSVFVMVHYEAKKNHIVGEKRRERPIDILKHHWHYLLPLLVVTLFMLLNFSVGYAAVLGIIACIAVSFKDKEKRIDKTLAIVVGCILLSNIFIYAWGQIALYFNWEQVAVTEKLPLIFSMHHAIISGLILSFLLYLIQKRKRGNTKDELKRFVLACRLGTENSLKIGAMLGVIGIIIGVLTFSGLVMSFSDAVISLAGNQLWLTILLIALTSLVLGMGVPVTAAYLITAMIAVPALTKLGVDPLAAHMIIYWLSQDSNITPPVCIAAYTGAAIAKANMWKTAISSFKFAKFLYLGPFLFAYVPGFTLMGTSSHIALSLFLIAIGTFLYGFLMSGIWIRWIQSLLQKEPTTESAL